MKFKHRSTGSTSVELQSTRTVTFFLSPEFGHMIVDGKCADSNVLDRGKIVMNVELACHHNAMPYGTMMYATGDFKCAPGVFVSRAELHIHDTLIANYTKCPASGYGLRDRIIHYTYGITIPEEFEHFTDILRIQVKALVDSLEKLEA